jgi:hypothetical protein
VTGYTEEALKLRAAIRDGHQTTAAVQRSLLALRLAKPVALRRRLLYVTENRLWDLVSQTLGEPWRNAQAAALGLNREDLGAGCEAALRLFALAVDEVRPLLDARQLAVVRSALG